MVIDENDTIIPGNEAFKYKLEGDGPSNSGEKIRIKEEAVNHQIFDETAEVASQSH